MIITCTTCRSQLLSESEGGIAILLKTHIETKSSWDNFSVGSKVNFDGYTAEVVAVKDSWGDPVDNREYSYAHQGDTFEAYVVFRVGDFFYRKLGTGDSYGDVSWDGDFGPVQIKTKQVTVYEF